MSQPACSDSCSTPSHRTCWRLAPTRGLQACATRGAETPEVRLALIPKVQQEVDVMAERMPLLPKAEGGGSSDEGSLLVGQRHKNARLSSAVSLALYAGGVYAAFIAHDYLQELLWHIPGFRFPQFMTLFEFASCAIFPLAEILLLRVQMSGVHPIRYAVVSVLIVPSMLMGTSALQFVSYPIKVVAKSTKLLPTMIIGSLLLGRRFNSWHYLAALCLCGGLAGFAFSDVKHSQAGTTSLLGLALLGGSVCLDAFTPNVQQKLLGNYKGSQSRTSEAEVMMYTNLWGCLLLVPFSLATGELWEATAFMTANPSALVLLTVFAMTTYLGVSAYLRLVSNFSGVTAAVVTTSRKVMTVVLSFLFFPKVTQWGHLASGLVVVLGLVCNELARRSERSVAPKDLTPISSLETVTVTKGEPEQEGKGEQQKEPSDR